MELGITWQAALLTLLGLGGMFIFYRLVVMVVTDAVLVILGNKYVRVEDYVADREQVSEVLHRFGDYAERASELQRETSAVVKKLAAGSASEGIRRRLNNYWYVEVDNGNFTLRTIRFSLEQEAYENYHYIREALGNIEVKLMKQEFYDDEVTEIDPKILRKAIQG